jgi:hypothetical protein
MRWSGFRREREKAAIERYWIALTGWEDCRSSCRIASIWRNRPMMLVDLGKLHKSLVGLTDIIGRLAKNIESAIRSGIRSGDEIRRARERKRLRNFMLFTAHLYREQLRFVSALNAFCSNPEEGRMSWESAKFEIVTIRELLVKLEKYILPYNDALVVRHRKQYLRVLAAFDDRRKLLAEVAKMEYGDAVANLPSLKKVGEAYERLMEELKDISLNLGKLGDEDEEMWEMAISSQDFESLQGKGAAAKRSVTAKKKSAQTKAPTKAAAKRKASR